MARRFAGQPGLRAAADRVPRRAPTRGGPRGKDQELVDFAKRCNEIGLEVSVVPRPFEAVNDRFAYEAIGGLPLLPLRQTRPRGRGFAVKHLFDRTAAILTQEVRPSKS